MNTPINVFRCRRERGASMATILVVIVIILALAAAVWFLILRPHQQAMQVNAPAAKSTQHAAAKAPPPANVAAMSTSQLLSEASKAIKDQRLLAPEGNNAFEFYLKVLDRQPENQVAKDALRETFPFAANSAEQVINQGDFAEANREIALLAKADPDNYTLTILRSKLDARRKVKAQQAQQEQLAQQKQSEAAKAAAAAKAKQAQQAQLAKQQEAQKQAATAAAAQKQQQAQAKAKQQQQQQPETTEPKIVIQNPVLVKYVKPRYPPAAARMRREGWVIVQFTVGVDGRVHDASVVGSNPHHVFNRDALRAVQRWQYKPALRNGNPFAVTMRKKIEFNLKGNQ